MVEGLMSKGEITFLPKKNKEETEIKHLEIEMRMMMVNE
jgi:hypothetical protein